MMHLLSLPAIVIIIPVTNLHESGICEWCWVKKKHRKLLETAVMNLFFLRTYENIKAVKSKTESSESNRDRRGMLGNCYSRFYERRYKCN